MTLDVAPRPSAGAPAPGAAGTPDRAGARTLRVASVPSGHVYVRHLDREDGLDAVERLPDPHPDDPSRVAEERWWPPVMLDPEWVERAAPDAFDVYHLQFGFDAREPAELERLVAALRRRRTPLVYTAHDLRNPHHLDRAAHDAQLDVLVPAADAVVTLTPGAAAEIRARWGVEAVVVPHPHVVDTDTMGVAQDCRARRRTGAFRIGLHLKSLRASMDPMAVLPTLVETVAAMPDAVLQVNAHHDVMDPGFVRHDAALAAYVQDAARAGLVDLEVHDYLPDDALWRHLGSLDASVLPYRFGTHSGWLEACRDLGTTVLAPTCGYFAEQGPVLSYAADEHGVDADSLAAAVRRAHDERPRFGATIEERRRQRDAGAATHLELYRSLVAAARGVS